MVCLTSPLLLLIIFLINNLMVREVRALKPPLKPEHLMKSIQSKFKDAAQTLTRIPLSIVVRNAYDFFYYLPRRNLLYDRPWQLFRNNTEQFLSWRQFPNQLPPYEYFGKGYPDDFFCYGLPGNTLPLGNWDPWGFQLVSKKVVQKYRESELKHGRLAMMAVVGFLTQESFHPLHPDVGGVAITHMAQLLSLPFEQNLLAPPLSSILSLLGIDKELVHVDYFSVVLLLSLIELWALKRNWSRWLPNEYNNQFDHNIGVGNLREVSEMNLMIIATHAQRRYPASHLMLETITNPFADPITLPRPSTITSFVSSLGLRERRLRTRCAQILSPRPQGRQGHERERVE